MSFAWVVDDGDKDFTRSADVQPDGSFQIDYVPAGTYTLMVHGSCDKSPMAGAAEGPMNGGLRRFKMARVPVRVMERDADVDEIMLEEIGGKAER